VLESRNELFYPILAFKYSRCFVVTKTTLYKLTHEGFLKKIRVNIILRSLKTASVRWVSMYGKLINFRLSLAKTMRR